MEKKEDNTSILTFFNFEEKWYYWFTSISSYKMSIIRAYTVVLPIFCKNQTNQYDTDKDPSYIIGIFCYHLPYYVSVEKEMLATLYPLLL